MSKNTSKITVQELAQALRAAHGPGVDFSFREFLDEMDNAGVDDVVDAYGKRMYEQCAWRAVHVEIQREPLWLLRYADGRIADVIRAGTREEAIHLASLGKWGPWRGTCSECIMMTWAEFAASHAIPPDRGDALDMADELGIVIFDGHDYAECLETEDDAEWNEVAS